MKIGISEHITDFNDINNYYKSGDFQALIPVPIKWSVKCYIDTNGQFCLLIADTISTDILSAVFE